MPHGTDVPHGATGHEEAVHHGMQIMGYDVNAHALIPAFFVSIILIIIALLAMRRTERVPRGMQALFEHAYFRFSELAESMMGPIGRRYVPFCMSLFLYILISNWIGLIPNFIQWVAPHSPWHYLLEPPATSLNVTVAMALVSFCAFTFFGIARCIERETAPVHHHHHGHAGAPVDPKMEGGDHHGHHHHHEHGHDHGGGGGVFGGLVKWVLHYIEPTPNLWKTMDPPLKYFLVPLLGVLFVFLNIVEELARILSLSFRLFGNIFGEHAVKIIFMKLIDQFGSAAVATGVVGFLGMGFMTLIMWGSTVFVLALGTLAGFIQAYVFALLSLSYIAHAVADHH